MLTLITGGARSGKSRLAEQLASSTDGPVTYIATAQPGDAEMRLRIRRHKQRRPAEWETVEEPLDLLDACGRARGEVVLLDCLSLWVANRLLQGDEKDGFCLLEELWCDCAAALDLISGPGRTGIVVTNEVGWSVVPENRLARTYRDLLGALNQRAAARVDRAVLTAAGIPVILRGPDLPDDLEVIPEHGPSGDGAGNHL